MREGRAFVAAAAAVSLVVNLGVSVMLKPAHIIAWFIDMQWVCSKELTMKRTEQSASFTSIHHPSSTLASSSPSRMPTVIDVGVLDVNNSYCHKAEREEYTKRHKTNPPMFTYKSEYRHIAGRALLTQEKGLPCSTRAHRRGGNTPKYHIPPCQAHAMP